MNSSRLPQVFIKTWSKTVIIFYLLVLLGFMYPSLRFVKNFNLAFFTQSTKLKIALGVIIGALIYQIFILIIFFPYWIFSKVSLRGSSRPLVMVFSFFIYNIIFIACGNLIIDNSPSFFADYFLESAKDPETLSIHLSIHALLFSLLEALNIFNLNFPARFTGVFSFITFLFTSFDYFLRD